MFYTGTVGISVPDCHMEEKCSFQNKASNHPRHFLQEGDEAHVFKVYSNANIIAYSHNILMLTN